LVEAGCRRVTEETVPVPDKTQRALGLCCDNNNNFATMSCNNESDCSRNF